jgi:hypothetical protein
MKRGDRAEQTEGFVGSVHTNQKYNMFSYNGGGEGEMKVTAMFVPNLGLRVATAGALAIGVPATEAMKHDETPRILINALQHKEMPPEMFKGEEILSET